MPCPLRCQVVLTPTHLCIKLEYAAGGELYNYIRRQKPVGTDQLLSEEHARYFFRQFIDAVDYLHQQRIAHRDLKLANTLVDESTPPRIKLCDFGLSRMWATNEEMNAVTTVGSESSPSFRSSTCPIIRGALDPTLVASAAAAPMYMPPEMMVLQRQRERQKDGQKDAGQASSPGVAWVIDLRAFDSGCLPLQVVPEGGSYDPVPADVWSCGVLLFVLLLGRFPFKASSDNGFDTVLREIRTAHAMDPDHLMGVWGSSNLSDEAKAGRAQGLPWPPRGMGAPACDPLSSSQDLLNRIFVMDYTRRITVDEIRQHPWYLGRLKPEHERVLKACKESQFRLRTQVSSGVASIASCCAPSQLVMLSRGRSLGACTARKRSSCGGSSTRPPALPRGPRGRCSAGCRQ